MLHVSCFMHTIVVIPAYNEEETIAKAVREAKKYADEIVVVDDGSGDDTSARAESAGAQVLRHTINRGQGAALRTAVKAALSLGAEIIVTFDADLQQDAAEIPTLIAPIKAGIVEAVLGSRFLGNAKNMPAAKGALLRLAVLFTRATTGLKITDTHNGFRALGAAAAEKIEITQDGFAHASEILSEIARHRISYCEVPVNLNYSAYSLKKGQKISNSLRILLDLLKGDLFR